MSLQQGPLDLEALRGSVAVVTGAGNNGIGWGLCRHAARLGMHVVAVDLHETLVEQAQARLRREFPDVTCLGVQCDVTRPESVEACLASVQQHLPGIRLGAVFANAGVIFNRMILESTFEEWRTTLHVNVLGVVNTVHAFVPVLRDQGTPAVFSATASIGGLVRGDGGSAAYQASKHAVVALSESLSFELARKAPHIRVHVLCPCIVQTVLHRTSALNERVQQGEVAPLDVEPAEVGTATLAMDTYAHARQVFDHIAAGRFYLLTENVRPYVDHDFPFGATDLIRDRFEHLLQGDLDNSDAFELSPTGQPSSIMNGPLSQEARRRAKR